MDLTSVYVQYIRFARRALTTEDFRTVFKRARQANAGYPVRPLGEALK